MVKSKAQGVMAEEPDRMVVITFYVFYFGGNP
jgi:hypothetical protein